jgi:hypothetical protein
MQRLLKVYTIGDTISKYGVAGFSTEAKRLTPRCGTEK